MLNIENKNIYTILKEIEKKVFWLSNYIIHYANNVREKDDDLKVGGHQASCASAISILVVLYFKILKKNDRIAIKPHASPVFHAIQYLLENQDLESLINFRKINGAQAYPSITKDKPEVDFSTGSVGLGGAMTIFSSIVQDYLLDNKFLNPDKKGKMISLFGDAELDEGNVYEALLEGAKYNLKNCWWIIDYNRQSLDGIIHDRFFEKIIKLFKLMGWNVEILKYGEKLNSLNGLDGGKELLGWIDECPNDLFSALTFQGGKEWRLYLEKDFNNNEKVLSILKNYSDEELHQLMTNLAGHDINTLDNSFSKHLKSETPTCFICYTVKGFGLPLEGHKDNHSGIMNEKQFYNFQKSMNVKKGREWDKKAGLKISEESFYNFLKSNIFFNKKRSYDDQTISIKNKETTKFKKYMSTQEAFGILMNDLGKSKMPIADRIITTSPDVTVSTNLGGWVNQRDIFSTKSQEDIFKEKKVSSAQKWKRTHSGQHFELGIAENNFFLLLASIGLSNQLFGTRLLPIGTIYDTFIGRGLDSLNYATYVDSRFIMIGTPSGVSLSHEGGAHQSITTPNIGIAQPNLIYYEPVFADELEFLLFWALEYIQKKDGSSVYFRLSTKKLTQPERLLTIKNKNDLLDGAYWLYNSDETFDVVILCTGVVIAEVLKCISDLSYDEMNIGVIQVSSPDKLYKDWEDSKKNNKGNSHIENMLLSVDKTIPLISIVDGHSSSLSWIGSVLGHKVYPMGVNKFGQSGDLEEVYKYTKIDFKSIIDNIAKLLINK